MSLGYAILTVPLTKVMNIDTRCRDRACLMIKTALHKTHISVDSSHFALLCRFKKESLNNMLNQVGGFIGFLTVSKAYFQTCDR